MPLESTIENYLVKRVIERGGLCEKLERRGKRGWPDRTVILNGCIAFVETKKPEGGVLSQQQKECHEQIRNAGAVVFVCSTIAEVDAAIWVMWEARIRALQV